MIPLFRMSANKRDVDYVSAVINRGESWAEGQEIEEFERGLCLYQNVKGALACNSGTSALHMALLACGVKHFHEVIVPSFTFIATANAVKMAGAVPAFADIEPETMGLDPVDVARRITPKTRAIIVVHYGGCPAAGIHELTKLARKNNLALIEDCAEAMGAMVGNIPVGKFGDCSALSFCQNKIISTGEGGAVITDNKFTYDQVKLLRSHGRDDGGAFVSLGYNFRMPSMNAALGISQLERIEELIKARQQIAIWYADGLIDSVTLPVIPTNYRHVYQLYTIRISGGKRDRVMSHLISKGIGCKVYFNPVHLTRHYTRDKWIPDSLPVTEQVSKEVLSLPMYPGLIEAEVQEVCKAVKEALN